jgi:plasmid stability protein
MVGVRSTQSLGAPVRVRLPEPLLEQLRRQATASDRSISAEIRVALRAHLGRAERGEKREGRRP